MIWQPFALVTFRFSALWHWRGLHLHFMGGKDHSPSVCRVGFQIGLYIPFTFQVQGGSWFVHNEDRSAA